MHVYCFTGQSKPILADLRAIVLPKVTAKWYELGIALLLHDSHVPKLDEIQETYPRDFSTCCLKMLHYWLKVSSSPTWNDLIEVSKSPYLELVNQAEKIESEIKS